MRWFEWVAAAGALLLVPYGIAIMVRPQLHGSRVVFIRYLGAFLVVDGIFLLASNLHRA